MVVGSVAHPANRAASGAGWKSSAKYHPFVRRTRTELIYNWLKGTKER
jgi:hypothetical protein